VDQPRNAALGEVTVATTTERDAAARRTVSPSAGWRAGLTWWREVIFVGLLYLVYEGSRLVPSPVSGNAAANARDIFHTETRLHLDAEHTLDHWLAGLPTAVQVGASYWYELLHYVVTPVVLIWLYRLGARAYRPARNALVATTLPALIVFWLFPVSPPRLLSGTGVVDIVVSHAQYGWWSAQGTAPGGLNSVVNVDAAMPSLHVGWALWCGIALYRNAHSRLLRAVGVVYPLGTAFVVLATGNHWLLDVLAGAALCLVADALVRRRATSMPNVAVLGRTRFALARALRVARLPVHVPPHATPVRTSPARTTSSHVTPPSTTSARSPRT